MVARPGLDVWLSHRFDTEMFACIRIGGSHPITRVDNTGTPS
jgi:hypothetical protein